MKALLINPENKTVTTVDLGKGLDAIYKAMDCDLFDVVNLPNGDAIYVDDEGLLKPDKIIGAFIFPNWNYPLVNKCLVIGTNRATGNSVSCKSTPESLLVRDKLIWIDKADPQLVKYVNQFN